MDRTLWQLSSNQSLCLAPHSRRSTLRERTGWITRTCFSDTKKRRSIWIVGNRTTWRLETIQITLLLWKLRRHQGLNHGLSWPLRGTKRAKKFRSKLLGRNSLSLRTRCLSNPSSKTKLTSTCTNRSWSSSLDRASSQGVVRKAAWMVKFRRHQQVCLPGTVSRRLPSSAQWQVGRIRAQMHKMSRLASGWITRCSLITVDCLFLKTQARTLTMQPKWQVTTRINFWSIKKPTMTSWTISLRSNAIESRASRASRRTKIQAKTMVRNQGSRLAAQTISKQLKRIRR